MKRRGDPLRVIAYLRVSTDAERQAHGLEVQRRAIEAWAAREGRELVGWHQDELSGTTAHERRPGLLAALEQLTRDRAGVLVVHRIDRLARDAAEGAVIERLAMARGAAVAAVEGGGLAEDAAGRLVRQVTLAAAEFEGSIIRERIRATKASMRARGLHQGGAPPYGWRLDGRQLIPAPVELATLERMRALRARGHSYRRIAAELHAAGLHNRAGGRWSHAKIRELLDRAPPVA